MFRRTHQTLQNKKKIVVLGGGFGGIYVAMHLQKMLKKIPDYEIVLVNRDNYFVYQPMLADVIGGSVDVLDTVSAIRPLLPKTNLFVREIEAINLEKRMITLAPQFSHTPYCLEYDKLVIAMGNVTDFRGMTGIHEHALPFKNLADSFTIRNQIIDAIESASVETDPELRKKLLTFVVGGGGFSGTEAVAEMNDLVRHMVKEYPSIDPKEVRVILVHSKDRVLNREMSEKLGIYAQNLLLKRGVEIMFNKRLHSATPEEAILDDGTRIPSKTIVSTVPSTPNPLIEAMEELPKTKGKIETDRGLQVKGMENIWALGDCAMVPMADGSFSPPTAQFAIRQAKTVAKNIVASINNTQKCEFNFKALGMLGALGHHRAVAEILGMRFSGIFAWFLWRGIYLMKLPGFARKIKVGVAWALDSFVSRDAVQLKMNSSSGIAPLHYEEGETIFKEGDIGDFLYIIVKGRVAIEKDGHTLAELGQGEYFGEMALLNQKARSATVKCLEATDVLALRKREFGLLISNFEQLKSQFEETDRKRSSSIFGDPPQSKLG
ncbi:MAG: FAD-dependent oxidoreductase [Simkaniaceae bacterium]|nr:FAD-dependent oxidoreductase [Simkaniaceae bacterium]